MQQIGSRRPSRSTVLRQLIGWHWVSSSLALFGMLFFSVTGFTLNHASSISATPRITSVEAELPADLVQQLMAADGPAVPETLHQWLEQELGLSVQAASLEWTDHELYFSMPRPGGDAWLSILLPEGELVWEATDRGWVAWLNDLHKGRHTGAAWSWFIDLFVLVSLVFCLTGLGILALHARERRAVWPVTGLGLVIPLLLLLLFVH